MLWCSHEVYDNFVIQKASKRLLHNRENVCMCIGERHQLFAVGSQSNVTFIDTRTFKQIDFVDSMQRGSG